ncbi:MAG: hypothetical protein ACXW2F_09190 [Thermoanaerobaculia bacterium]
MKRTLVFAFLLFTSCSSAPTPVVTGESDELQIKSTVLAAYNVISGPAGRRDWDRFEELFAPGARLILAQNDGSLEVLTPHEYAMKWKPLLEQTARFERPVTTRVEIYGKGAHVMSAFESRRASTDPTPFARGVDSIQLIKSNGRWQIATIGRQITQ